MPSRNLERKVKCGSDGLDDVRQRLANAQHRVVMRMEQIDTYFASPRGRLKVRELRLPGVAPVTELIGYDRPSEDGSRWSAYEVVPLAPENVQGTLNLLAITQGQTVVVRKRREVALWGNTRVHFDVVDDFGAYVELETVIVDQDDETATAEHHEVIRELRLERFPVEPGSYSDLLAIGS